MRFTNALLAGAALPAMSMAAAYPRQAASVGASGGVTTSPINLSSLLGGVLQTVVGIVNEVLTLIPPPNGQAVANTTLALPAITVGVANLIKLKLNLTVGVNPDGTLLGLRKRQVNATDCTLGLLLDGQPLLNVSLTDNGGTPQEFTTDEVPGSGSSLLSIVETCGGTPININLLNLLLIASPQNTTSSSSTVASTTSATTSGAANTEAATTTGAGTGGGAGTTASASPTGGNGGDGGDGGDGITASVSASVSPSVTLPPLGEPTEHLVVNSYNYYACVGSAGQFPTFTLAGTNDAMDIEMCTTLCLGSPYAGLHDTECYCGQNIDGAVTAKVDNGNCDIPCPGDPTEICGGNLATSASAGLSRRQVITDPTILLTVFVNPVNAPGVVSVSTYTTVVPEGTLVVTSTAAPAAPTASTSVSVTIGLGWFFEGVPGSDCGGEIVFVPENCTCHGGWGYVPKTCTDDSCNDITVYKPKRCEGDNWAGQTVFTPSKCDVCAGGITWTQTPQPPTTGVVPGGGIPGGGVPGSGNSTVVPGGGGVTPTVPGGGTTGVVVVAGSSRVVAGVSTLAAALSLLVALF